MSVAISLYKKLFLKRYDEKDNLKYYRLSDFKNFKSEKFSTLYKNNKINGEYYYYKNYKKDELIIFLHGLGGGRSSYLKEIEHICSFGYKVLAYDYLGCVDSEGENILSLHEPLGLLIHVLDELKINKKLKISLIGHSWGAFTSLNVLNYVKDIDKVIAISGFISAQQLFKSIIPKPFRFLTKNILKYEYNINPKISNCNAIEALENTNSKVLIIQDITDPVVKYNDHTKIIKENINNKNVRYFITNNRKHNPYYTEDGVSYMNKTFAEYNKLVKQKKIKTQEDNFKFRDSVDFDKMTQHSNDVFDLINKFLKG